MFINIIRGQQQIGGSIIEVGTDKTKIIFDVGINLDESEDIEIPKVDGLFCGDKKYDAVFISHYHSDHIGLLENLVGDIPIYIGEKAHRIVAASYEYRNLELKFTPNYIKHNEKIIINDINITPISCDHSAFDSYMYLIEADNKKVLYTGDFRANGRFDYNKMLEEIPTVDALIIEGTTLSRNEKIENTQEEFLEDIAVKALQSYHGPAFVMMSAMNVDRITTSYNVAKRTNRLFLEDIYTAQIAEASGEKILKPNGVDIKVFMTGGDKQYQILQKFGDSKIGKEAISKSNFLMCIRPSMRNYLEKLNELVSFENGLLFYGMWKGYLERPDMKEFIDYMSAKGVKIHILHTSGHADANTIDNIVKKAMPTTIIPVHTENDGWFSKYKDTKIIYSCKDYEIR